MVVKVDPLLAILISSIREIPLEKRKNLIIQEKRKLIIQSQGKIYTKYSSMLKLLYMRLMSYKVTETDFLNACASTIQEIKNIGYLGVIASEDEEIMIMLVNTIMKDLNNLEHRNDALSAICNIKNSEKIMVDLKNFICPQGHGDPFHNKTLVASAKLNPSTKLSLVGNSSMELFVKIQILLENQTCFKNAHLTENDVNYLSQMFTKQTNNFLRVKMIQFYRKLYTLNILTPTQSLVDAIDNIIIPSRDRIRPQVEIALAIEGVKFLLQTDNRNPKADAFVFRLIESKNPNSRYFGLKMAREYKIHKDIVIDRCIKTGLHINECFKTLCSFINRNNYKSIYKRREEIQFYMEKNNVSRQIISEKVTEILCKIANISKDDFFIKIYLENPEICIKLPFDKNIPKAQAVELFNKIFVTVNSKYFPLIYQLLPSVMENHEFLNSLYEKHLNILFMEIHQKKTEDLLLRLMDCMISYGSQWRNRKILISKYKELAKNNYQIEAMDIMLNTIYLLNSKLDSVALHITSDYFLYYAYDINLKVFSISHTPEIEIKRLLHKNFELIPDESNENKDSIISKYKINNLDLVTLEFILNGHTIVLELPF